jgi:hypothetical protein
MWSVVDRNVVMRRMTVYFAYSCLVALSRLIQYIQLYKIFQTWVVQLRCWQLYVDKNKIDFFTECSQMPWVIQQQSICTFSVFWNSHSQSIYHKFDLYVHFHDVLSVFSDLPQFSLSAFKPQLHDRQQNDYISNAKKRKPILSLEILELFRVARSLFNRSSRNKLLCPTI